jgi:arylsulfatase A-like enzyme
MTISSSDSRGKSVISILVIALWFGLTAGLLEGLGSLFLNSLGRLSGVWVEILWISPFFVALLFTLAAVPLLLLYLFFPRLPVLTLAVFCFAFLTFSIWLSLALPWEIHVAALLTLAAGLAVVFTRWFSRHQALSLRFWHSSLPIVAALALLVFLGVQGSFWFLEHQAISNLPPATPGSPNILLIVVDTLRADHVSSYGYHRLTSPTIDQLAQEGALFETAFSTAPYTTPPHASLLTGRYPHQHGVQWLTRRPTYDGRFQTLPEALQAQGYRTAAFSANRFWFTREQGFGRGFTRFEDNFHSLGDMAVRTVYGRKFEEMVLRRFFEDYLWRKSAPEVNASVLSWLRQDQEQPFFAFLNYFDVHDPYFPPQPYRSQFSELENPGGILNSHQNRYNPEITPKEIQQEIDAYDGAISYVDEQIAQLLAEIEELGLGDNLVVAITSDHGEAFGEHGTFIHANSVYREEIHVPLILWQPGEIPEGVRVRHPVSNGALPATILELAGLEQEGAEPFPIKSLRGLWAEEEAEAEWGLPLVEMEHWPWMAEVSPSHHGGMRSMISVEHHYIEHEVLGSELYDWEEDQKESRNLADYQEGQSAIDWFQGLLELELSTLKGQSSQQDRSN